MYRLTLDVPYRFIVYPAYERAQHAVDQKLETAQSVYHDPNAGLLILMPSCMDRRWQSNLIPLSQINYRTEHWREARRGLHEPPDLTRAPYLARVRPRDTSSQIELLIQIAIIALSSDPRLAWVMETVPSLARDESWALHITCADDEYSRDDDYWYAQWDRYALSMDTRGQLALYLYDRSDLQLPPMRIASWYSGVSSPLRSALTAGVIPCPPLGLLVLTLVSGGSRPAFSSGGSTTRQLMSSRLIPMREYAEDIGTTAELWSIARPSPLRLAVNTRYNPIVNFERVRYPASGYAIEYPHALPPISPQVPTLTPIVAPTHQQSATASPLLADGTAWGTAQAPTAYRVRLDLTTTDPRYTPIVVAHYTRCEPYITQRDTTPVVADRVLELELTRDEYARDEGSAEVLVQAGAIATIAQRGDTTYQLEYSADGGTAWHTLSAGFATVDETDAVRSPYRDSPRRVRFALRGMWSRFAEIYQMADTAFDNITLADAFNKLLEGCGFERIPDAELPTPLKQIRLPAASSGDTGQGWRYAPRVGQSGDEILQTLLLLATATGQEWRLRYDADAAGGKWVLEQKPAGTPAWTLDSRVLNPANRTARYATWQYRPRPPEANLIWVEGASNLGKEGERLVVQIVNESSLTNPASLDYLGRIKLVRLQSDALDTIERVEQLAERVYAVAARHAESHTLTLPLPNRYPLQVLEIITELPRAATIVNQSGVPVGAGYIKRATLTVRGAASGGRNETTLRVEIDSRHESDPRER